MKSEKLKCGFCYDREQGTHGEVLREWSTDWNMFISFCRDHSPERRNKKPVRKTHKRVKPGAFGIYEAGIGIWRGKTSD